LFASYYDKLEEEAQKAEATEAIKAEVEKSLAWGCGEAALFLGDAYYDATCGFEEDLARAFSYYAKGAILGSADCYGRMYEMIVAEEVEGYSQDFADHCAISAARLGSQDMMRRVVAIYKSGRLTDFASEIEQYYLPVVEAMDDDDMPDDDGRYDAYA
jgi:TPR repeat protein